MEYPDSALSEIKTVLDIVRGGELFTRHVEFAKAAWVAQGWIQAITLGEPNVAARAFLVAGLPAECSTEADAVSLLEALAGADDTRQRAFSIPPELLQGLLTWLMARLLESLNKRTK